MNAKLELYKTLIAKRNEVNRAIAEIESEEKYSAVKMCRAVIYVIDSDNTVSDDVNYNSYAEYIEEKIEDEYGVRCRVESCQEIEIVYDDQTDVNRTDCPIENYQAYFK